VALVTDVAAIIVTRGDQDLTPVAASIPDEWDIVIYDGSREKQDLAVYGRYAAIERTDAEMIYVQDDDCVVSDPQIIVDQFSRFDRPPDYVVCNMPQEFRHSFYEDHALVGFGAAFHRDVPDAAFARFAESWPMVDIRRDCDMVFTALTPRILVDVPYENLPWAHYENRLWTQPGHQAGRVRMLELIHQVVA
jgi:hypothetical protein